MRIKMISESDLTMEISRPTVYYTVTYSHTYHVYYTAAAPASR
jgi:hypothetical protein